MTHPSNLNSPSMESSNNNNFLTSSVLGRILWQLTKVSSGLIAILLVFLYIKQESLLYFPSVGGIPRRPSQNPRRYRSPEEYHLPFESHFITTVDGVKIHLWLLLQPQSHTTPTILFFHGNAGNIGLRLPNAYQMYHQLKANIVMVEYRGYGDSEDHVPITEQGLKWDAQAAWEFIRHHPKINPSCIFLFGRSLGGAVALDLARFIEEKWSKNNHNDHHHDLMGVMVENTFLSIGHMVNALMPFLRPLKFFLLRMDWNNEKHLHQLQTPVLFLAGDQDELVPHAHMQRLHQLALIKSKLAKMHIIRGGTHNDSWVKGGAEYYSQMKEFMNHAIQVHQDDKEVDDTHYTISSKIESDDGVVQVTMDHEITSSSSPSPLSLNKDASSCATNMTAIPIMPRNILSIAKEASVSLTSTSNIKWDSKKYVGAEKNE